MHLQNAAKLASLSRKPSTGLRQRLEIQKCELEDRLPVRQGLRCNGKTFARTLWMRKKPETHDEADGKEQCGKD
jgi:hypothetical protein